MSAQRQVLVVFPTLWDQRQAERPSLAYEQVLTEPSDWDREDDHDVLEFVERHAQRSGVAGVTSSSDYPGATVAAALAERLGLRGAPSSAVLGTSHKYYARLVQAQVAPEATPACEVVDARRPELARLTRLGYPCFVKPVKGAFSVLARRIASEEELRRFLASAPVQTFVQRGMLAFDALRERYSELTIDGGHFIAEELIPPGSQVTLEGYVRAGQVELLGIVDSIFVPGKPSFARFECPSHLPAEVQARMADLARRLVPRLGLDHTLFNVELVYDPAQDRIWIVEVNPRMCGQFADLYEKLVGVSGYELAWALACGVEPPALGAGPYRYAASVPLRVFAPTRVVRAPTSDDVAAAEALYPHTRVWIEAEEGQDLSDFQSFEDGHSARYAVINLGAESRAELVTRAQRVAERLGFQFDPDPS